MNAYANQIFRSSFASDNNSGIHPEIFAALQQANHGHVVAYGDDPFTTSAISVIKREFGERSEAFFVFNGTGANVSGLGSITRPFQAIICARSAHINIDECNAPERFTGCKLLDIETPDGKVKPSLMEPLLSSMGDEHQAQPAVVSITQATEYGTVYRPDEIREIAGFVHDHGMILHMDGARLANAAAFLGCSLREITGDCGVDLLSFGGTKNGLMYGEAVIFFSPSLSADYRFVRKQATQLASKMRFIAVQFEALLRGELWRRNAMHANNMAVLLTSLVSNLPGLEILYPVEANAIFVRMPKQAIESLLKEYFFYVSEDTGTARFMTSFDTSEDDVRSFVDSLRKVLINSS